MQQEQDRQSCMSVVSSDSHNFGLKAFYKDGKVFKPRSLGIEWLFLSSESPLRKLLKKHDIPVVRILPSLDFEKVDFEPSLKYRSVTFLDVKENIEFKLQEFELVAVGSLVAICQWFGLGDLHVDNIIAGFDCSNKFLCSPIDLECFMELHRIPSQSLIIPSRTNSKDNSGLAKIIELLERSLDLHAPAYILSGYLESMEILSSLATEIYECLIEICPLEKLHTRVILKDTSSYKDLLAKKSFNPNLYNEEIFQLRNNDIPYFFKFCMNKEVYYWKSKKKYILADIELNSVDKLGDILKNLSKDFFFEKIKDHNLKVGALQIAKYFDVNSKIERKISYKNINIYYNIENIEITTKIGNIKCLRS